MEVEKGGRRRRWWGGDGEGIEVEEEMKKEEKVQNPSMTKDMMIRSRDRQTDRQTNSRPWSIYGQQYPCPAFLFF